MNRIALLLLSLLLLACPAQARTVLTSAGTLYVTSAGNDGNDCLTAGTACATPQGAVNRLYRDYDAGCQAVKISVGSGTFAGATLHGALPGLCSTEDFVIEGDTLTPATRVLTTGIAVRGGARVTVKGVRI